jgi:hypothetical protein
MIDLKKAQNRLLVTWAIGVIPLVIWLFLIIKDDCDSCIWTPLSYATPPLSMMVLVFFNRDMRSTKISKDKYLASLVLSVIYLATISGTLLYSAVISDPIVSKFSVIPLFEKFDQLLTFIFGLTMAGLGVVFSNNTDVEGNG